MYSQKPKLIVAFAGLQQATGQQQAKLETKQQHEMEAKGGGEEGRGNSSHIILSISARPELRGGHKRTTCT